MPLIQDKLLYKSTISLILVLCFTSIHANSDDSTASEPKVFDMIDENESLNDSEPKSEIDSQAEEVNDERSTSEKLEALKQDVIAVNRDLFILEEDLLFPASTQVALYFSVDIGYFFALDNLKLKIDDEQVTHHLYTEKDVDALYRGAIQKAYLGNINTGEHEIVAVIVGTGPNNRSYRKAVSFTFEKTTGAKAVEIQLRDDSGKMQPILNVVEW